MAYLCQQYISLSAENICNRNVAVSGYFIEEGNVGNDVMGENIYQSMQ